MKKIFSEILEKKTELEKITDEGRSDKNDRNTGLTLINSDINFNEVSNAIDNTEVGKAYLNIPNDVLKNDNAKRLLHKFFNVVS